MVEIETQTQEYTGLLQSEFGNDLTSLFKLIQEDAINLVNKSEGKTIEEFEAELLKLL